MKKYLALLCGSLVVLLMFAVPGNPVKAADDCECHNVTQILGAEKNKIVSNLISTEGFKNVKKENMNNGYQWNGVSEFEVIKHNLSGQVLVGVPFLNQDGTVEMFIFSDGILLGHSPK